jgi:hypothetical protein
MTFTIASCELLSEIRKITDRVELRIATFLLLYGDWAIRESPLIADGDKLVAVEHQMGAPEKCAEAEDNVALCRCRRLLPPSVSPEDSGGRPTWGPW